MQYYALGLNSPNSILGETHFSAPLFSDAGEAGPKNWKNRPIPLRRVAGPLQILDTVYWQR
jgi:hypothetical protein